MFRRLMRPATFGLFIILCSCCASVKVRRGKTEPTARTSVCNTAMKFGKKCIDNLGWLLLGGGLIAGTAGAFDGAIDGILKYNGPQSALPKINDMCKVYNSDVLHYPLPKVMKGVAVPDFCEDNTLDHTDRVVCDISRNDIIDRLMVMNTLCEDPDIQLPENVGLMDLNELNQVSAARSSSGQPSGTHISTSYTSNTRTRSNEEPMIFKSYPNLRKEVLDNLRTELDASIDRHTELRDELDSLRMADHQAGENDVKFTEVMIYEIKEKIQFLEEKISQNGEELDASIDRHAELYDELDSLRMVYDGEDGEYDPVECMIQDNNIRMKGLETKISQDKEELDASIDRHAELRDKLDSLRMADHQAGEDGEYPVVERKIHEIKEKIQHLKAKINQYDDQDQVREDFGGNGANQLRRRLTGLAARFERHLRQ